MSNQKYDHVKILAFVESHTYKETSAEFGISEMQISRIKKHHTKIDESQSKVSSNINDSDTRILELMIPEFVKNRLKVAFDNDVQILRIKEIAKEVIH